MRKIKVFIADDHKLFRAGLIELLKDQESVDVVGEASDGEEALKQIGQWMPDIVLMDIRMAPIDGIETSRRIRNGEAGEESRDVYIIALTAHALEGDREKCLDAGMNDYLSKPLSLDQLNHSLKKAKELILDSSE